LLGPIFAPGYSPNGLILMVDRGKCVVLPLYVFQISTTVVTVLALVGLARSVVGRRHLLVLPLWIILVCLQCAVWCMPGICRH
jgi:hypothetical protein